MMIYYYKEDSLKYLKTRGVDFFYLHQFFPREICLSFRQRRTRPLNFFCLDWTGAPSNMIFIRLLIH